MPPKDAIVKVSPKTVSAHNFTVHGDFNINDRSKEPASQSLTYTRIKIDQKFWEERDKPFEGFKPSYPFDQKSSKYFYLRSHLEQADPFFDVLITNDLDHQIVVLAIGVAIIQTADVLYAYGGPPVTSFSITMNDIFSIQMPRLKSLWPEFGDSYPPRKEDIEVTNRDCSAMIDFDDPLAIEGCRSYRFGLYLDDYVTNMPNNAVFQFMISTNMGMIRSDSFYIFTY